MKTPPDSHPPAWLTEPLGDDASLADDGFTARVMSALPPRRVRSARPRWTYALPPLFAAAGCAACWVFATTGQAPGAAVFTSPFMLAGMLAALAASTVSLTTD